MKKRLLGHEFTIVKNGLAEEEVATFVQSLGSAPGLWAELSERLARFRDLSQRLEHLAADAYQVLHGVRDTATRQVEQEKEELVRQAQVTAQGIVAQAEEEAMSIRRQWEVARAQAAALEQQAKAQAAAITREAQEEAARILREAREEAQAALKAVGERVRLLVAREVERSLRGLGQPQGGDAPPQGSALAEEPSPPAPETLPALPTLEEAAWPVGPVAPPANGSSRAHQPDAAPRPRAALLATAEGDGAAPAEGPRYQGPVLLRFAHDAPLKSVFRLRLRLDAEEGVEVLTERGTRDGLVMELLLHRPVPLLDVLGRLPEVVEVTEIADARGRGAHSARLHVVLRTETDVAPRAS